MGEKSSGSISVQVLSPMGKVFGDEQVEVRLRGFALAFDRLAKASTFVFNANSSNCISEVSCSLSSSLLLKSVTNLFKWGTERSGVSFTTLHCHGEWEGRLLWLCCCRG